MDRASLSMGSQESDTTQQLNQAFSPLVTDPMDSCDTAVMPSLFWLELIYQK